MKANKAPDATIEMSPSQKKLKQARLPFKLISEVAPSPESPQTRKRKLSVQDNEVASKINKVAKENDIVDEGELVLISDEESNDKQNTDKVVSLSNPYIKLVNKAIKKKQQKTKTPKKKKGSKNNNETISEQKSIEVASDDNSVKEDVESMEVDEEADTSKPVSQEQDQCSINDTKVSPVKAQDTKTAVKDSEIIDLDNESNDNSDTAIPELEHEESHISNTKNTEDADQECSAITTPKRSTRIKKTQDEKDKSSLNSSKLSSKLDESVSSVPSTPKTPKMTRSSVTNNPDNESLNESTSALTPKQLQKKLESAKKREEKEKEKQEKEKKRQQEKEERDKIKKDKEDQKRREREEREEAKRKEREEKEEQRKKEKEEKERQKEQEKKLREEKEEQKRKEREEKEEQRKKEKEARDDEKRKKLEAAEQEKLDQELKKKKAAEAFANFFVPKQKTDKDQAVIGPVIHNNMLSSFTIKADMRLAPTVRLELSEERKLMLEEYIKSQNVMEKDLYVKSLKDGARTGACGKTWPLEDKDDDVLIVEDELQPLDGVGEVITCESAVREKWRPKLLSFHENRRPPYWGTWRKKSAAVRPRRPFGQDEKQLEYEVDSDDEWEEEQEGESIDGSAAGSDAEADNDEYEVDNELFVPHGYLSDEEATMDEDDVLALSPEAQQARLKHLEDEFESEMKKPTEKLKPRLYGPIWETAEGGKPDNCADVLWNYFGKLAMIMNDPTPLLQPAPITEETEKKKKKKAEKKATEGEEKSPKSDKKKKAKIESKESKKSKVDDKKSTPDVKKNQLGINSFLTKVKST